MQTTESRKCVKGVAQLSAYLLSETRLVTSTSIHEFILIPLRKFVSINKLGFFETQANLRRIEIRLTNADS